MAVRRRWIWSLVLSVPSLVACSAGASGIEGASFGGLGPGDDSDSAIPSEDTDDDESEGGISAGSGDDATTGGSDSADSGLPEGDCTPGDSVPCYGGAAGTEGVGECRGGTSSCGDDGTWGACEGEVVPTAEACNGLDDDCNGSADDGDPEAGAACNTGLIGPCAAGTTVCNAGALECVGEPPAATETCGDSLDNNCNGTVDEGCTTSASCDPMSPSVACGASQHCFPTESGDTLCQGPTGLGTQYGACTTDADCTADHVCVDTGLNTYCLQWCTTLLDCPGFFDDCVGLDTPVYAGPQEYGVCYDGLG